MARSVAGPTVPSRCTCSSIFGAITRRPYLRATTGSRVTVCSMLLDQRRTKRMVKIVSIISALAFAGVIFVVLGVIFAGGGGGGGGDPQKAAVSQAEAATRSNPQDLQAWVDLGRNYEAVGRTTDAQTAYERAISIGPKNADELNSLVAALSAN